MDVADEGSCVICGRALDAEEVECDPYELHELHGDEDPYQRDGRVLALDGKCGGGVVDGKHRSRPSSVGRCDSLYWIQGPPRVGWLHLGRS
jgi:hypothetical protein